MITDLLARQAGALPDRPFLVDDGGELSFRECLRAVRRFAATLAERGVNPGDHVALAAGNSSAWLVAMLAINWRGAVAVALNNQLVGDGLRYTLRQCDASLVVADAEWIEGHSQELDPDLARLPLLPLPDAAALHTAGDAAEQEQARVPDSAPCTILYTSGTTGLPKGVVISHTCYQAVGRDTARALAITAEDRLMVFLPLFHTNPQMYALMSALETGCALIIRPRFSASAFFADAKRFEATGFSFVGTVMSILVTQHAGSRRDHRLRFAVGGGTPVPIWQAAHERFGFRIHELYGMTEIGGWVSCNLESHYRVGSCGPLRDCMDVRIFGPDDRELPAGEAGEIVVRPREPDVILSGYYRKAEELVSCSRNFWFHTGDRGLIDAEGYLHFLGRTKELIRRGGEMLSPIEIETQLRTMAGVSDCAAVGVPDDIMGEEIKVCVLAEGPADARAVLAHLAPLLPRYMLPRYVEFVELIPKTETEKIQRNKLQAIGPGVLDMKDCR